jgi:hypothetical protein
LKVTVKYLDGTKWKRLPAEELVGNSLNNYILNSTKTIVACLFKDDKPIAFISNDNEWVEKYAHKGLSLHARDLQILLGTEVIPYVVASTLGGEVVEIKTV